MLVRCTLLRGTAESVKNTKTHAIYPSVNREASSPATHEVKVPIPYMSSILLLLSKFKAVEKVK